MRASPIISLLVAACGSSRTPTPPGPVDVDTWCNSIADRMCDLLGTKCGAIQMEMRNECTQPLVKACVGTHTGSAPSGRTGPDLDKCLAAFDAVQCEALKDPTKLDKNSFDICVLPK